MGTRAECEHSEQTGCEDAMPQLQRLGPQVEAQSPSWPAWPQARVVSQN